ncbi:MAG: DNA repair protein RecN [Acidimicrobiales bacterium]|nr:DNA repair protein RecN [Acidimicrobiales bacterium]
MTGELRPADQLLELSVTDLGIIEHARLLLGPGMTALTGETGAGKTLIVGAIALLLGGRAEPGIVRAGATEAVVEARFTVAGDELVLTRVVPAEGRSRAYVNGRLATAGSLAEAGGLLVDLHGQHDHQSLLGAAVQRAALDEFGDVDLEPLRTARAAVSALERRRDELGGDPGARAREADLLSFQVRELDAAGLTDPDEDVRLDRLETTLADAAAHREAAATAAEGLGGDGGAIDAVGAAIAALGDRAPFADPTARLRALQAELGEVAGEVRTTGEAIDEDPARLTELRERRQLLVELRRKYATAPHPDGGDPGDGTLADVLAYHRAAAARLDELARHDTEAAAIEHDLEAAREVVAAEASVVGRARRAAAEPLATAVEAHLGELAMPGARFSVEIDDEDPGDRVAFALAANRGAPPGPLAKVASGGELARCMLALRLVLRAAPPVLVFDEVDAGIGGEAALAVGRSLAALGAERQVLVVTHLPQVAAFADHQVTIRKETVGGVTIASATPLAEADRVVELSRMLSGTPDSTRVQDAASELLTLAATERGR